MLKLSQMNVWTIPQLFDVFNYPVIRKERRSYGDPYSIIFPKKSLSMGSKGATWSFPTKGYLTKTMDFEAAWKWDAHPMREGKRLKIESGVTSFCREL